MRRNVGMRGRVRWWAVAVVAMPVAALAGVGTHEALSPQHWVAQPGSGAVDIANRTTNPDSGVVDVVTQLGGNARGAGTGIVLSPDGTVLTNNHVIEDATNIQVTDVMSGRIYPATVSGYSVGEDLAVLHVAGASGLPAARIGDSSKVQPDDPVMAVGNAGGRGGAPAHADGRVTGVNEAITAGGEDSSERLNGLFRVSARLERGDSGGPLLDGAGRVVGVDTATSEEPRNGRVNGPGYVIPINTALRVAAQVHTGRQAPGVHIGGTGLLGVSVVPPDALSDSSGSTGAAVVNVSPGSGAEQAGIVPGDVVVSVDGHSVATPDDLTNLVREHHPGESVRLSWVGTIGKSGTADVPLGSGPPA